MDQHDELEKMLTLLRTQGVTAAEFDEQGTLRSVRFAPVIPTADMGDSDDGGEESQFRTAMHNAAGVLQGRHRSMREDSHGS